MNTIFKDDEENYDDEDFYIDINEEIEYTDEGEVIYDLDDEDNFYDYDGDPSIDFEERDY